MHIEQRVYDHFKKLLDESGMEDLSEGIIGLLRVCELQALNEDLRELGKIMGVVRVLDMEGSLN